MYEYFPCLPNSILFCKGHHFIQTPVLHSTVFSPHLITFPVPLEKKYSPHLSTSMFIIYFPISNHSVDSPLSDSPHSPAIYFVIAASSDLPLYFTYSGHSLFLQPSFSSPSSHALPSFRSTSSPARVRHSAPSENPRPPSPRHRRASPAFRLCLLLSVTQRQSSACRACLRPSLQPHLVI